MTDFGNEEGYEFDVTGMGFDTSAFEKGDFINDYSCGP